MITAKPVEMQTLPAAAAQETNDAHSNEPTSKAISAVTTTTQHNHHFTAIIQVSRHLQLRTGGFRWCKSFTACMPLLMATSAFGLGRRGWSSHQCYLHCLYSWHTWHTAYLHKKGIPYSITEHRVPELITALGSQPAGDVSHKPGGRPPLLSARPAVILATFKRAAVNFTAWWT